MFYHGSTSLALFFIIIIFQFETGPFQSAHAGFVLVISLPQLLNGWDSRHVLALISSYKDLLHSHCELSLDHGPWV